MITGIIAILILVVALPTVLENGETLAAVIAIGMAVLLLALGSASRKCDKAYNNMVDYWDKGGPVQ